MNNENREPLYDLEGFNKKLMIGMRKQGDEPYIQFDIKGKLTTAVRKRLNNTLLTKICRLFRQKPTKESALRFADVFIANLLRAYRLDCDDPSGVELATRRESAESIQSLGMRKISDDVVEKVIGLLVAGEFIKKRKAKKKRAVKVGARGVTILDAKGKPELIWVQTRSTVFVAKEKLIKILNGDLDSKICRRCGIEKPIGEFGKQRDGWESECKVCRADRKKTARQNKGLVA